MRELFAPLVPFRGLFCAIHEICERENTYEH
jgi:hypothetical protein